jgi:hypothetical protein
MKRIFPSIISIGTSAFIFAPGLKSDLSAILSLYLSLKSKKPIPFLETGSDFSQIS